jgi:hypothetical protein
MQTIHPATSRGPLCTAEVTVLKVSKVLAVECACWCTHMLLDMHAAGLASSMSCQYIQLLMSCLRTISIHTKLAAAPSRRCYIDEARTGVITPPSGRSGDTGMILHELHRNCTKLHDTTRELTRRTVLLEGWPQYGQQKFPAPFLCPLEPFHDFVQAG